MSDDTTAALQALLQQFQTLTNTVTDQSKRLDDLAKQNDGLRAFNSRVLDEKKDAQRQLDAKPPKKTIVDIADEEIHERKMRAANLEKDADGNWYPQGVKPKHSLTREDARDPAKYRAAKEAAHKAGATLTVIDGSDDPTIRNTGKGDVVQSKTFTFDDTHERVRYLRADMETGKGIIGRRMRAEQDGYTIKTFRSPDELPPHARTKFDLMERAANAES
ncbi:hypothetical protein [Jannaschia helgolandensis]|uniref:Uncharacterized protein n=1 Tax=Jannaschia helgolandensis TaxID=188906 RepID=A0A1H7P3H4_9RHOB|nr:hypothetical protein [Jannaschia helgolandensis]SEL29868.1 hypothetical protein SAMN04488526_2391 [Jannaschia helgolandensis]